MKKNLVFSVVLLLAMFTIVSAQNTKSVSKGLITISTGQKLHFINLKFQGEMVVFTNTATKSEFTYFLKTVLSIEDENKNIIYKDAKGANLVVENSKQLEIPSETIVVKPIKKNTGLVFKNCRKAYYNGEKIDSEATRKVLESNPEALRMYNSGRTLNTIGDIALGAGIGLAIGTGINNLNEKTKFDDYGRVIESNGGPTFIIVGLLVAVSSIPLKIIGRSKVKESIWNYNHSAKTASASVKYEIFAVAKGNGAALVVKF